MSVYREPILPVASGVPRPVWSVMIPTYHCASYLRDTLTSVLIQDPGPDMMQIEVVDDHSTRDNPEAVVNEIGRGRVTFTRQPANVGHVRNFNTCLQRSRGHLVHLLHGDDMVRDGFYRTLQAHFEAHPEIGAAFCRHTYVNDEGRKIADGHLEQVDSGVLNNWLERISEGQRIQPPAIVVRRAVYEQVGGFDRRIRSYGEDWEMWVRIAADFPVWYEPEILAMYRIRSLSLSDGTSRSGENLLDLRRAIEINTSVLPPEHRHRWTVRAKELNALGALRRASRALDNGDAVTAAAQIRGAMNLSRSPRVLRHVARLSLRQWRLERRRMRSGTESR